MKDKRQFAERAEAFLKGRGFYVVLFACVAVIGVSAWALFFSGLSAGDEPEESVAVMAADAGTILRPDDGVTVPAGNDGFDGEPTLWDLIPKSGAAAEDKPEVKAQPGKTDSEESGEKAPEPAKEPAPAPKQETASPAPAKDALTFIWPLSGEIVAEYSPAVLIYNKTMNDWRTHDGIDVEAKLGTKVLSCAAGTVTEVYDDAMMGTTVVIDHGDGLVSIYSNLAAVPTVTAGDAVAMGSVIGSVGDTTLAETGEVTHLHLSMMKEGVSADPLEYLPER